MSHVVFWLRIDVSGCLLGQNGCLKVCSVSKVMSQDVIRLTIDVSVSKLTTQGLFLLFKMNVSGCFPFDNRCVRVFSGSKLMSQGVFLITTDVSVCFLRQ